MSRTITARDYMPAKALARVERENERRRQLRIAQFLPDLAAHRYLDTTHRVHGVVELHSVAHLPGSSERWVKAIIHDTERGPVKVIMPRIMTSIGSSRIVPGQCSRAPMTLDIHVPAKGRTSRWFDRTTHYPVETPYPVVLRRHA